MTADRAALERHLAEVANLYEIARALLGARDPAGLASRAVLGAMGSLGARSGAALLARPGGALEPAFAYGPGDPPAGIALDPDPATREWALRRGAFRIAGSRAAAPLREALAGRIEASAGAAIADRDGLAGLLVVGPRLADEPYDDADLATLEAIAGLLAQALAARGGAGAGAEAGRSGAVAGPGAQAGRGSDAAGDARPPAAGGRPGRDARALDALRREHPALRALVGASPALLDACEDLVAAAATRYPVLLTGESGVGKEVAARALHAISERAAGPFEVVDCGSIPRELIESELFGHVKGAFTGAQRDRRGAFELADRGTLFLDEIGEMPLQLQTRLLRVLQEGRFRRVGDERATQADVRVVAATNRDLAAAVEAGRFRQDLYFRLNVFAVRLPPLRERLADLPALVRHFLPAAAGGTWSADDEAIAALGRHDWPGNVRELANLCSALAARTRAPGRVTIEDLDHVWRRQRGGDPPWRAGGPAREETGAWVLGHARAARFNLVEVERRLRRAKRGGGAAPVAERTALGYWLTGEILRALAAAGGDAAAAARAVAGGDDELLVRARARVDRVASALRAAGSPRAARRRFAKLPPDYAADLERALAHVT